LIPPGISPETLIYVVTAESTGISTRNGDKERTLSTQREPRGRGHSDIRGTVASENPSLGLYRHFYITQETRCDECLSHAVGDFTSRNFRIIKTWVRIVALSVTVPSFVLLLGNVRGQSVVGPGSGSVTALLLLS